MKIELGKEICGNFKLATSTEWLECNELGAYASSTIYGLNSRRFHGLLVVPLNSVTNRAIILSKFEESVFFENHVHELSANQFVGGVYPDGHKYLQKFSLNPFPTFIYQVENRRIEKTLFLLHDQNALIVRYALKNHGKSLKLVIKPIMAGRLSTDLMHETQGVNTDSYQDNRVVKIAPKKNIPELNIYYSQGEYHPAPLWYHNFEYLKDISINGNGSQGNTEDLFNPGFFTFTLNPYQSIELVVSTDEIAELDFEAVYRKEKEHRRQFSSQFINLPDYVKDVAKRIELCRVSKVKSCPVIIPNYHWGENSLREALLTFTGFVLVDRNYEQLKEMISYLFSKMRDGLLPSNYPSENGKTSYQSVDTSLILINLTFYLQKFLKDKIYLERVLFEPLNSIIDAYQKGTHYNIHADKDGLLFAGEKKYSTSWMPLLNSNGEVVRYGKMLEINALWYNALKIMEYFSKTLKKNKLAKKFGDMAELTKTSFIEKFYNKKDNRFYDFIRDDIKDNSFRINQIFSLALPFSMPALEMGKKVLKAIDNELLTPYGLRSLSFKEKEYIGHLDNVYNRTHPAYYNGSVWPWTIGFYVDAVIKYNGRKKEVMEKLKKLLDNFKNIYANGAIGYISEILEGNEPHRMRGAISNSLNLTELLRAYYLVELIEKRAIQNE